MTFEAFIARGADGREVDYDKSFEREPVIQIARALYEHYGHGAKYYALLANLDLPTGKADHTRQVDAVLLSEDGLGVLDFKHALGAFTPTLDDRPWVYATGKHVSSGSRKNANPFRQVEGQREAVYHKLLQLPDYMNAAELPKPLREHATRKLKSKKSNKNYYHFEVAGRCVLTGTHFDMPDYKKERHQRWFDIIWMDEVPRFAKTLSFNKGMRLSDKLIRTMVHDLFGLSPWIELESLYRKPYGYLQHTVTGRREPLLSAVVTIGRNPDLDIRTPLERKHVSRRHAVIRQTPNGAIIQDMNSTHGTWVNSQRVSPNTERPLRHNDTVTLGSMVDDAPSVFSMEFRYVDAGRADEPDLEETMGMPLDDNLWFPEDK